MERNQRNVDAKLNAMYATLIEMTSEQFFRLLDSWIYFGNLNDDYALEVGWFVWLSSFLLSFSLWFGMMNDFLTPVNNANSFSCPISKSSMHSPIGIFENNRIALLCLCSFERRYRLIDDLCPAALRNVAEDILKCGKYVRAIRKSAGIRHK